MYILIEIPQFIQDNISNIKSITLQLLTDCSVMLSESVIPLIHVSATEFVVIQSNTYKNSSVIIYSYTTLDNTTNQIVYNNKEDALYKKTAKEQHIAKYNNFTKNKKKNWIFHFPRSFTLTDTSSILQVSPDLLYYNKKTKYKNDYESQSIILKKLDNKYKSALTLSNVCSGKRDLIYYTILGDKVWLDLLELSLNSIYLHNTDVDILIITSVSFSKKIKKFSIYKKLKIDFLLVPNTNNKIIASINKLLIYKYNKINLYKRVLFLDCDIIAFNNFKDLFLIDITLNKLYTVWESNYVSAFKYEAHRQPFHGLGLTTDSDIINLEANQQMPFNAGQFMFAPCPQMLKHFENIYWLSRVWPAPYFFEQSVMTHYFCFNNLTEAFVINDFFYLLSIKDGDKKEIKNKKFIHFIGNSTNATSKINFIKDFIEKT